MKKTLLAAMLAFTALPASADIFGLSVGATAGAAQLDFQGNKEYGYEYGLNASYALNDFFSINAGVVQAAARWIPICRRPRTTLTTQPFRLHCEAIYPC